MEPEPAAHHRLIIDKLEAVERGDIRRLMIFAPPGSAKSTYASVLFPSWYMGRNRKKNVIAASYTAELAERFGRKVRNIAGGVEYRDIYGDGLSKDSLAAGRWALDSGGEYYAVGAGGSVTGFRADGGIIDDPVKGREEAGSQLQRDKIWEWYKSDFWTRLKPDAWLILIMTRWHIDDLAGRLLKDAEEGGEKWEVLSLPAEAEQNDALGRKPGELLWPEWYKPHMIEQAKRDPRLWAALYQQRPVLEGGEEFKRDWIQYYSSALAHREMNVYILVDPAHSKKKSADFTAMMVWGLAPDNNYYLLDVIRDRLNPTERIKTLMRLHKKWNQLSGKPPVVGYEQYGLQSDLHWLQQAQNESNYRFASIALGGKQSKEDRIRRLVPVFEARRVYFPQYLLYTDHTGKSVDLIRQLIEEELLTFPVSLHDDMIDAAARICDEDLHAIFPRLREAIHVNVYNQGDDRSEDWMNW